MTRPAEHKKPNPEEPITLRRQVHASSRPALDDVWQPRPPGLARPGPGRGDEQRVARPGLGADTTYQNLWSPVEDTD